MTSDISNNTRQRICSHLQSGKLTRGQIAKICGVNRMAVAKVHRAMPWVPPAANAAAGPLSLPLPPPPPLLPRAPEDAFSVMTRAKARANGKAAAMSGVQQRKGGLSEETQNNPLPIEEVYSSLSQSFEGPSEAEQNGEESDKSETTAEKIKKIKITKKSAQNIKKPKKSAENPQKTPKSAENPKKSAKTIKKIPKSAKRNENAIKRAKSAQKLRKLDLVILETVLKAKHLVRVDTNVLLQISLAVAAKLGLADFNGTVNWLTGFKRRSGIRLRNLGRPERDMSAFDTAKVLERVIESVVRDCSAAARGDVLKSEAESVVKSEEIGESGGKGERVGQKQAEGGERGRLAAKAGALGPELESLWAAHFKRFEKRLMVECFHLYSPFSRAKKKVLRCVRGMERME